MKNSTIKQRKRVWKYLAAITAFNEAEETISFIATQLGNLEANTHVSSCIWTGFVTTYGRPFTHNGTVGPISEEIIPAKHKFMHNLLMNLRNKLCGHTDDKVLFDSGEPVFKMGIEKKGQEVLPVSPRSRLDVSHAPEMLLLVQSLQDACDLKWREELSKLIKEENIPEGKFTLNLDPTSDEIFVPGQN